MKSYVLLPFLFFINANLHSQDTVYYDISEIRTSNDMVFCLQLRTINSDRFPVEIFKFQNLRSLDISMNSLVNLPDNIDTLKYLESLTLTFTKITTLPNRIGNLHNIKEIILIGSRINALPESIGNLTNLETLNLSFCPIGVLPKSIFNLQKLKMLILDYKADSSESLFSKEDQTEIKQRLPHCTVIF
jgi:Leucine-rich repeat (LRR) protein